MGKIVRVCITMVLLFAVQLSARAHDGAESTENLMLIGWDGAQRQHVNELLARGELPQLQQLISEGTYVPIDILGTTDTKAGWTQILTGYRPWITGVYSNDTYGSIPEGYTVFERLEEHFGNDNFFTAAVIAYEINMEADKGMPYYHTKNGVDVFMNGLNRNETVGATAIELLKQYHDMPFFFFIHFGNTDFMGHVFGENSEEYELALKSADAWLGKIIEQLKNFSLYEKTVIYVTADHGFDEGQDTHDHAPHVFLATNDLQVIRRGERVSLAPTILHRFGVDLTEIEPPLQGYPLTYHHYHIFYR